MTDTQITDAMLKEWEELCDFATIGPWTQEAWLENLRRIVAADAGTDVIAAAILAEWPTEQNKTDAKFIAAARTALPLLIEEIRRLRHGG